MPSTTTNLARLTAVVLIVLSCASSSVAEDKMSIRTELQVAMQRFIDRSLIEGSIRGIDKVSGEVRQLYPVKAHPIIMKAEDYFVMCASLIDERGQHIEADYYITDSPRGFRVFQVEVDNREVLYNLISAGHVAEY